MFKTKFKKGFKKVGTGARIVAQGDALDMRWFGRHFFLIAFSVMTIIAVIATRFEHQTSEATTRSLRKDIARQETFLHEQQSRYMTLTRESAMIHLVDSLHLGLEISNQMPQTLRYNIAPGQRR